MLSSFFEMGGYGGYIWPAYGLTTLILAALWLISRNALKADENTLRALQEQNPRRRRPANAEQRTTPAPTTTASPAEDA